MDILLALFPLLIFGGLLIFLFRGAKPDQKALVESANRASESNDRLAEAVNRLADVIANK